MATPTVRPTCIDAAGVDTRYKFVVALEAKLPPGVAANAASFPKGTDLSRWSAEDLEAVAYALNNRPRKILGWKTPAEVFDEQLRLPQQPDVASTG